MLPTRFSYLVHVVQVRKMALDLALDVGQSTEAPLRKRINL